MRLERLVGRVDVWPVLREDARGRVIDELAGAVAWRDVQSLRVSVGEEIRPLQDALEAVEMRLPKLRASLTKANEAIKKASQAYNFTMERGVGAAGVRGTAVDKAQQKATAALRKARHDHDQAAEDARKATARLAQLEPLARRLAAIREPECALLAELGIG